MNFTFFRFDYWLTFKLGVVTICDEVMCEIPFYVHKDKTTGVFNTFLAGLTIDNSVFQHISNNLFRPHSKVCVFVKDKMYENVFT